MAARLDWHGDGAKKHVRSRAAKVVSGACLIVQSRAKVLLSVAGSGRVKGRKVKGGKVTRSLPGESPRKQTGELRLSVATEVNDATLTGRVGSNLKKAKALELGTRRGLLPRPWLRRALAESRGRINALLAGLNGD